MNIQAVNSYTNLNIIKKQIPFKEADLVEDYQPTPYERDMDSLYRETENQISVIKYLYKENPLRMEKAINEIYEIAAKKREVIKSKYLKSENIFKTMRKF